MTRLAGSSSGGDGGSSGDLPVGAGPYVASGGSWVLLHASDIPADGEEPNDTDVQAFLAALDTSVGTLGGGSVYLSGNTFQMFRARVSVGGTMVWRWHLSNWTPDASSSSITVGNAAHWAGSAPTTIKAAIDRLAAQVYALGSNTPIP